VQERRSQHIALLLLSPALLLLAALFIWPVGELIAKSFQDPGGAWVHYQRIVEIPTYLRVVSRTLLLSAATALACLALGYPIAYRLTTASSIGKALILICIFIPFWTNLLVRSYGWIVMLNPQGIINGILLDLGLISLPLKLVYNTTGVLIGMTQIMLPYMILPLAAVMSRLDPAITNAARSLGARPAVAFLKVYFPLTLPGVMAGLLLVFMISLGFFVIPALLGGSREILLAQLIEFNINNVLNWGFAAALSTTLLAATLLLYWAGDRWFKLGALWGVR
jgi:ABC-type spermidine/putrescine transport system permease subunit I